MTQDTMRAEFEATWHSLPLPGEYDSMDDCDRWRWKNVAWIVWNSAVAATRERDAKLLETFRGHEIHETILFRRCATAIRSQP